MEILGYDFEGPYADTEDISSHQIGIYVIVCLVNDAPHCVLDVGTSEGGGPSRADITPTGNLQYRIKNHERKQCWKEHVHGSLGYYIKPLGDTEERLEIESRLRWRFEPICGTSPWEREVTVHDGHEEEYGPRGIFNQ
jgi:hypothetical protein